MGIYCSYNHQFYGVLTTRSTFSLTERLKARMNLNLTKGCDCMKKVFRIILFIMALAIGGWLGTIFLTEFEPLKMLAFFTICGVLGVVFRQIDKRITKDK